MQNIEIPDSPLDFSNYSIYYVLINDKKINLVDATVKTFLDAGFYLDEDKDDEDFFDENTLVEPNSNIGSTFVGTSFYKEGAESVFGSDYESVSPDMTYVDPATAGGYTNRYFCFVNDSDDIVYEIFIDTNQRITYDWE